MDHESDTVAVTVRCLCKKNTFTTGIAKSALPLKGNACHCTSCRHASGALYLIGIPWPQSSQAQIREKLEGSLKEYRVSERLTHLFCGTCSTPLFYEREGEGEFGVFSGSLSNNADEIVHITEHIYVGDTGDGGASVWLRRPNADGVEIPRYEERDGKVVPWGWSQEQQQQQQQQGPDSVSISCHCKGVNLLLHRADSSAVKTDEMEWFIDPRNNKRLASFDACDSCRLHFGNDIVHWTFSDLADISGQDGSAFPRTITELRQAVDEGDPAVGTLACYPSSVDAQRYSCGRCGAAVFYTCDDRPRLVDVGVGLLGAEGGARAEEFLSWTLGEEAGWVGDVKGGWREGLMGRVRRDAEEYRAARGYAKSWRRLAREEKGEA